MKNNNHKKLLNAGLHLLFWIISINFWHIILNHGVESTFEIDGFEVGWSTTVLINCVFTIYLLMPFIWLSRQIGKWVKIAVAVILFITIGYIAYTLIFPSDEIDWAIIAVVFVQDYLYVLMFHITIVAAFYFNLKVLIGKLLAKSMFAKYILSAIALAIVAGIFNFSIFNFFIDKIFPNLFFISYFHIWELILIVSGYIALSALVFLIWQYATMLIAKRDEARNELSALKAQINPHFLFNNLNTIYTLAAKNDARTKDVILQLSDFLRYVLYDTSNTIIPLEKEVEIIRTYVELQKERVNPALTQIILTEKGDFGKTGITPLLLLPLTENCFKHGIGNKKSTITIFIGFDSNQLLFKTTNQIALREKPMLDDNGGIGIKNVEKRLNLLYPERHTLVLQETDGVFNVTMTIDLK